MDDLNVALVAVGGLVLVLGLFSGVLRRSVLSEPLVALLVGILLGPGVLGALDVAAWGRQEVIIEQAARLTLAIGLMGVALRLPKADPIRRWRSLAALLGLLMPLMWLSSGLLVYVVVGLPFWLAMLIGAVLTPTDPVVATTIVTGRVAEEELPESVRHTISEESGFNDGLAYPFVALAIYLLASSPETTFARWLAHTLLWEVGAAALFGAAIGYGAGRLLQWAEALHIIEQTSLLAYTLALTLFALAGASLLGTDGILAVFIAGLGFDMAVSSRERAQEERVQEAVNRFFTLPIFVLLGIALPWRDWLDLGWTGVLLLGAILLLRRLPAILMLRPLLGRLRDLPDALFMGWFGPIGVAALYYSGVAQRQAGAEEAWIIGSLVICGSVLIHGVTALPFTRLYSRHRPQTDTAK